MLVPVVLFFSVDQSITGLHILNDGFGIFRELFPKEFP